MPRATDVIVAPGAWPGSDEEQDAAATKDEVQLPGAVVDARPAGDRQRDWLVDVRAFVHGPNLKSRPKALSLRVSKAQRELMHLLVVSELGLAVATVSLNTANGRTSYRLNLTEACLVPALRFEPKALTQADKLERIEVVLEDWGTAVRIQQCLAQHGLGRVYEVAALDEPIVLDARLVRTVPHTPSVVVAWPPRLKAPAPGRTTALLVPVMEVRLRRQVEDQERHDTEYPTD